MTPELMARLMGLDAGTSREELMKTLLASHPQGALLTQLLEKTAKTEADNEDEDEDEDEDLFLVPEISLEDLEGSLYADDLTDEGAQPAPPGAVDTSRLAAQVHALTERCATLASALGACGCFGELDDCPECRGMGISGWREPDREAFALYVAPLFRRFRSPSRKPNTTDRESAAKPPKGNTR